MMSALENEALGVAILLALVLFGRGLTGLCPLLPFFLGLDGGFSFAVCACVRFVGEEERSFSGRL
jgi:hypothetical protein